MTVNNKKRAMRTNLTEHQKALLDNFEERLVWKNKGYAGILPNGNIVDRRKHPEAIPVQKNELLGFGEPKKLKNEK